MKDEVQASLDRIESLVEAGNAKVDVTNNLLTELINKYENGSLSKEDFQKLLDAISKNGDKIDVKKEIEATLAAKKSEQMIMSLMPVGIILYLQMTSPGFLSVLYGNPFGIAAMSICLVIYAAAYWLGRRIVDIEV